MYSQFLEQMHKDSKDEPKLQQDGIWWQHWYEKNHFNL